MATQMLEKVKEFPLFAVIIALTFLLSGTICSLGLLIVKLTVWPFSHHYYRQLSYYFIYPVWAQLVFLIDWWAPSELIIYTDKETEALIGHEHAMVVMNHSYDVDWLAGWLVCERSALLAATKVFAKRSLSYVPIIGWLWRLAEIIFLDRDWQKDRSCIVDQIAEISKYANPVWILLFPEGTRLTPAKHKTSVEFANKHGLPVLKHHLMPRTKGFVLTIQAFKEAGSKFRAIYDVTLGFESGPGINEPTLMNLIKGRPLKPHMRVIRTPIEEVPTTDTECAQWMHECFQRKDKLLGDFLEKQHYEGRRFTPARRPYTLINEICWVFFTLFVVFYFCGMSSSSIYWWILGGLAVVVSFAMQLLTNVTVIGKGSAYGKTQASQSSSADKAK